MKNKQCKVGSAAKPFRECRRTGYAPSFLIFAFSALLLSCKKDIPNKHPEVQTPIPLKTSEDVVKVVDGVLSFIDAQTMDQYLKQLIEMPDSLRKIQEAAWGFTSYASILDSINDYIASASTENEMLQRINANSAFVCIKDSTLVSQLPSFGHHYIANADGIFKADSTYYRIFRQGIAAWRGASLNQMKNLTLNGDFDEDPADGKYFYLKDVTIEPTENNCGDYKRVEKNSEGGWYRVIFEIKLMRYGHFGNICKHTNQQILHYQYICNIILRGQVKRFWMWHSYKTSLEVQDVNFELLVPRQDNYDTLICSYVPRFEIGGQINYAESKVNSPELSKIFKDATDGMGDVTHNYNLSHPVFIKVRGKGKSAALGIGNWATFSCGY